MLVRLCGLVLIVLGVLFWLNVATSLEIVHILIGVVLVLGLWALAYFASQAGTPAGQVWLAVIWGVVLPVLGLTQAQVLPGDAHWVIQIVHLLLGIGAVGQAEALGARLRKGAGQAAGAAK